MKFEVSEEKIMKHKVGWIIFNSEVSNLSEKEVMEKLKEANYQKMDLDYVPFDFCSLPNNTLLVGSISDLHLCDESFNLIQTINKIGNQTISPYRFASNSRNQIYICNRIHHIIDMTDLKFNLIKSYGGSRFKVQA